jgi:ABC-type Fe3+ transport system permease subunit
MPAYLAYAGYSILRDPTTATGDWLGRQGNAVNFAAGQLVALATLALWMHPLCALVLARGIGRVPRSVDEQLRLDGAGAVRRTFELLRASRGVVVVSILTATVVFLGSAVPLHLAQVWTGAITVWRVLDKSLTPWPAWAASWPLLGMAAAVGVWAGWYGLRAATAEAEPALGPKPAPGWFGWAALLWAVGGVLPVGLFAWSLGSIAPVVRFWRERAEAIGESLFVAAVVGVASALLAACVWAVCFAGGGVRAGGASRLGLVLVAGAFAGAAALPGVLVGSAVRAAWVWAPEAIGGWVTGGPTILVLAHVARLGIIAVGAGVLLAAGEPSSLRDTRALDGAIGWAAFWRAGLAERWPGLVGVALVCAALSVGEVEATIIVQPPGSEPLARVLLDLLHYLKMQDLAAAAVTLIGGSGVVSAVGAGLIARTRRRELP